MSNRSARHQPPHTAGPSGTGQIRTTWQDRHGSSTRASLNDWFDAAHTTQNINTAERLLKNVNETAKIGEAAEWHGVPFGSRPLYAKFRCVPQFAYSVLMSMMVYATPTMCRTHTILSSRDNAAGHLCETKRGNTRLWGTRAAATVHGHTAAGTHSNGDGVLGCVEHRRRYVLCGDTHPAHGDQQADAASRSILPCSMHATQPVSPRNPKRLHCAVLWGVTLS